MLLHKKCRCDSLQLVCKPLQLPARPVHSHTALEFICKCLNVVKFHISYSVVILAGFRSDKFAFKRLCLSPRQLHRLRQTSRILYPLSLSLLISPPLTVNVLPTFLRNVGHITGAIVMPAVNVFRYFIGITITPCKFRAPVTAIVTVLALYIAVEPCLAFDLMII